VGGKDAEISSRGRPTGFLWQALRSQSKFLNKITIITVRFLALLEMFCSSTSSPNVQFYTKHI
jgi:hypothetical protein